MKIKICVSLIFLCTCSTQCQTQQESEFPQKNIYFGDIHNHCNVGYAKGSLERAYDIAQNHLDFYCFTPHSQWHDQPQNSNLERFTAAYHDVAQKWDMIKRYANDANQPGKFVSFIGYEWHSSMYGDVCMIMPGDDGELRYFGDIKMIQQYAQENNAILIPHHPAYMQGMRGQNWSVLGPLNISPVVEIFSEHGDAESDRAPFPYIRHSMGGRYTKNTIQYLWSQGIQVGIVASTDDHLGHPGSYGEGLAAVYADTLTRESIMEAIKARRTYAVSQDRIELDFRLNGHWMGETIPAVSSRKIFVKIKGKDVIDRVEVLRNNKVIYRDHPVDRDINNASWEKPVLCRIEYGWGPWGGFNAERIIDWNFDIHVTNGKLLSATPCFQCGPLDENRRNKITPVDNHRCQLSSYTSRKQAYEERATNSVILEIQGTPETELALTLTQPTEMKYKKTLSELTESNDIIFTGGMPSESIMIHRIVFADNYFTEFNFKDRHTSDITDWYYVRVTQTNGSLAWSSPVWIEGKK
ncbi:DUF3604 domain-containing protein [candidate division KSB1 bacterium]|nr:DUF3604 domain-containing protein [candidate division KSB1 bacterium]